MRKSGPRLWARDHHVEEQATERHTDRERVGQLGSPPFQVLALDRKSCSRMRHERRGGIGPVDKIWLKPLVHGGGAAPAQQLDCGRDLWWRCWIHPRTSG
jgi:hypothetical protein